jgi:hypothetical protein
MEATMSNRLDTITGNNKRNRVRDLAFAAFIAIAAALAVTSSLTADHTPVTQR